MSLSRNTNMDENIDSSSASAIMDHPIRAEWLGTSELSIGQNLELQKQGKLNLLISQRKDVVEAAKTSYDPSIPLILGYLDLQLGFTDIVASNAYKALLLVEEAMKCHDKKQTSELGDAVLQAISSRLGSPSHTEVQAELRLLKLQAYQTLLMGLAGCCAFWDGLKFACEALKAYPDDDGLKELKYLLKEGFLARNEALQGIEASHEDRVAFTRCGKIYHKQYPWLDGKLFKRTTAQVQKVNKSFSKGNCEVRRAFFGPDAEMKARNPTSDGEDVGPLGIFATRDIKEGETLMVDRTILGVSDVPSSRLQHCDACHASLQIPYIRPENIVKPNCCVHVAFCSTSCHGVAVKGYHAVLCGKDFEWLYEDINNTATTKAWSRWRAILFLRVMAVVTSDFNALAHNPSLGQQPQQQHDQHQHHHHHQQHQNPLSHPLLARLTASYPSPSTTLALTPTSSSSTTTTHDWQFFEDVEAPTRILRQLGIDVFTSPMYTPEVIQTILARLENNANQSTTALIPGSKRVVHMICVNLRYVFFNHSCDPNVGWYGAVPSGDVDVGWLNGGGGGEGEGDCLGTGMVMGIGMASGMGDWVRPGESAVVCRAGKAIGKGQECRISYVGDPMGVSVEGDEGELGDDDEGDRKGKGKLGVSEQLGWEEQLGEESAGVTEVIEIVEAAGDKRTGKQRTEESKKIRKGVGRAAKRHELEKWCEGGCGCQVCEAENLASAKENTTVQAGMLADMKAEENPEAQAPSVQEIPAEIISTINGILL